MKSEILFWLLITGLLITASPVQAQQSSEKVPRIGYLVISGTPDDSAVRRQLDVFGQSLKDLGYVDGKNILIEFRHPKENPEQAAQLAAELLKLKVDVIVAVDPSAIRAAKQATKTIPIVIITNQDPVAAGSSRVWRVRVRTLRVLPG